MSEAGSAVGVALAVGVAVSSTGSGAAWPSPLITNIPVSNAIAKIELISHFKNGGIRFTLDTGLDLKCSHSLFAEPSILYPVC